MKRKDNMLKFGFTLVELLVVIGIIMVLVALGLINYSNAQKTGRDAKRKADIKQIQSALEMYRADNNRYVVNSGPVAASLSSLETNYLSKMPSDPVSGYNYYYTGDGITYTICSILENTEDPEYQTSVAECGSNCGTNCNYKISSP